MPRFNGIAIDDQSQEPKPRFGGMPVDVQQPPAERGLRRAALQGATFGAGDEIAAGLTAAAYKTGEALGLLPESGQSLGEIYREQAGREREQLGRFREQNPGQAFAAELAGGLLTGGAGASRLAGTRAAQALTPMARAAAIGGTEGAIYGGLSGKPGERLESAGIGAATGAVGAPVIQAVGRVAGNLGRPVGQRLRNAILGDSTTDARNFLASGLVREGVRDVGELAPTARGGEMATLADVSHAARGMLEGLVTDTNSRQIRRLAQEALGQRNRQNQARLFDLVDEDLGTVGRSFQETVDRLRQVRGERAAPLYQAARQKPLRATQYMRAVISENVPEVMDAFRKAQRQVASRRAAGDSVGNIDVIDEMKRVMDDQISTLYRQGSNNRARDLVRIKNRILDDVDVQIPEYKAARNAFAGDSALIDAAERGRNLFKLDTDELGGLLRGMSDSERGMFRIGAKKAIREKLMQAREGTNAINRIASEINLDKIRKAFPNDASFNRFRNDLRFEANIFETERVLHNSMTALRQAERRALEQGLDFDIPNSMGNDVYGITANAIKRILNRGLSDDAKVQLGQLILTPLGQLPPRITQRINRTIQSQLPDGQRTLFQRMLETTQAAAHAGSMTAPAIAPSVAGGQ